MWSPASNVHTTYYYHHHHQSPHKYQFNNQRHDILVSSGSSLAWPHSSHSRQIHQISLRAYLSQRVSELIQSLPACNYTESLGGCWTASGLCGSHFQNEGTAWL